MSAATHDTVLVAACDMPFLSTDVWRALLGHIGEADVVIPRIGGGLIAAYEVLVADTAIRNLIKEGKTHQLRNSLVTGQRDGMVTFEQSLSALVQAGLVSQEDALARSLYPRDIEVRPRMRQGMPA